MTVTAPLAGPIVAEIEVVHVQRLSPAFVRLTVGLFRRGAASAGQGPPYKGGIVVMSSATSSIAITSASSRPSRAG